MTELLKTGNLQGFPSSRLLKKPGVAFQCRESGLK